MKTFVVGYKRRRSNKNIMYTYTYKDGIPAAIHLTTIAIHACIWNKRPGDLSHKTEYGRSRRVMLCIINSEKK